MGNWITDRKPTVSDTPQEGNAKGKVWVSGTSQVQMCGWDVVDEGEPWQPIEFVLTPVEPTPYTA
jgi:hypothetical protein